MTDETAPTPHAPVSTFAGVNYDVLPLAPEEAAFIDFARKLKADGGVDFFNLDKKDMRHFYKFKQWRRLGPTWKRLTNCEGGIVSYERIEPDGKGE